MSEQQNLLVHSEEAALWELRGRQRKKQRETVFCVVVETKLRFKLCVTSLPLLLLWGFSSFLFEQEIGYTTGILQMAGS